MRTGRATTRSATGVWAVLLALVVGAATARAGLVAYWPFDESSGQTAYDQTGVNNGQLGSTPGADASDPTVNQPGRPGSAGTSYGFDGSNDYVVVPDDPSIGSGVRDALTLSMWLRPAVALGPSNHRVLEKGDAYFFLEDLATGGMNFLIKQGNSNRVVGLKENLPANTWHHLAAQFDGATKQMKIYLDGGLKNVVTVPGSQIDDDGLPLRIGSDDSGRYFPGQVDEPAIYDHLLSNYQIIALAQGATPDALPATPAPLITSVDRTGSGLDPMAPEIRNGALAENALAWVDRTHELNAVAPAHPELIGADYVKIANDDRSADPFRLNVGLAQDATVYVAVDNRVNQAAMRQWMSAYGFRDTDPAATPSSTDRNYDIGYDESGDGDIDNWASVYWGNFPAGSVDLFQQAQGGTGMYVVAAVPGHLAPSAHAYVPLGTGTTFLEQAGQVVIEAENYTSRATDGTHNWLVVPDEDPGAGPFVANARGGKYVQSLPDITHGGLGPTNPPYIEYQVAIATPGQYQLYLRWDGNNTDSNLRGKSDSIFVDIAELKDGPGGSIADWYELTNAVNGDFASPPWDAGGGFEQNQAAASDNPIVWTVTTPGIYTVRVSMREDGSNFDAMVLQLSSLAAPTNPGPAESDFSTSAPLALAAYSKLGGDPDLVHPLGIAGGLANGAPAFADAAGVWTSIPPELVGADYIRTENDDAGYGFADYSLIAGSDAYLYIFLDDRYVAAHGIPQWMVSAGFVDTDLDVLLDGSLPFSVFQSMSAMGAGQPTSVYGLGYDLAPAYDFYGIAVSPVAIVPEPSSLSLLALGGLAALLRSRRRNRRA